MEKLFTLNHSELMKLALDSLPKFIYFENFSKNDTVYNGWTDEPIGYDGQELECTACYQKWSEEGRKAKHKEYYTCPHCGNIDIAYNLKKGRSTRKLHLNLVIFRKEDYDNVWAECIRIDAEDFTDIYEPRVINFQRRALYHFRPGKAEKYKGSYDGSYRLLKKCTDYKFYVGQMTAMCHEEDFETLISLDVAADSFLKYFELNKWENSYILSYATVCCNYPTFAEFFTKMNMRDIIKDKINESKYATEYMNLKAATVPELFPKLSKKAVKRLIKYLSRYEDKPSCSDLNGALHYLSENEPDGFNRIEDLWFEHAGKAAGILAVTKGSPVTLFNYFEKQKKGNNSTELLTLYSDYIGECKKLGYSFTSSVLYPKNLREKHAETSRLCRYSTTPAEIEKSKKQAAKLKKQGYNYSHKRLTAVIPSDTIEIIREGAVQNHCVGGYCERHASGETTIIFIRKNNDIKTPYFTLQIGKKFEINQCFGKGNRVSYRNNLEVSQFLEHYVRHLKYCKEKGVKTA